MADSSFNFAADIAADIEKLVDDKLEVWQDDFNNAIADMSGKLTSMQQLQLSQQQRSKDALQDFQGKSWVIVIANPFV